MVRWFVLAVVPLALLTVSGNVRAAVVHYGANLNGASESPPVASPGVGIADVYADSGAHFLQLVVSFSGLLGTTTASHIHAPTATPGIGNAPVATQTPAFIGFPLGVSSGTYDHSFDTSLASTWNPGFIAASGGTVAAAEAVFFSSLDAGKAYLNIHTNFAPGGEIRGFLTAAPEPGSLALIGAGILGLMAVRRRAG